MSIHKNTYIPKHILSEGFFTIQKAIQGRSLAEIEQLLGFHKGRLKNGCMIGTLSVLPGMDDFHLAGYSQVASHRTIEQYGNINAPKDKSEKDAYRIKKTNAMSDWSMHGTNRLVKIFPDIRHNMQLKDNDQYPPGLGIPQWNLIRKMDWKIIAVLKDYPNDRFIPNEGFQHIKYR